MKFEKDDRARCISNGNGRYPIVVGTIYRVLDVKVWHEILVSTNNGNEEWIPGDYFEYVKIGHIKPRITRDDIIDLMERAYRDEEDHCVLTPEERRVQFANYIKQKLDEQ
jgi:hypothetical protein